MKFRSYIIFTFLLCAICLCVGCEALQVFSDADGKPHTQVTDAIQIASQAIGTAGSFVPGYGLLASGVSALLGVIASSILAFRVKSQGNKLNTANGVITTLVQGVNLSAEKYASLKESVLNIANAISAEAFSKTNEIFEKFEAGKNTIKDVIRELSVMLETRQEVHAAVKTVEGRNWLDKKQADSY